MNGTDVQTTLREMWETRPARPRRDRKVAGVAAAIARRYDLDPVLVRIGFVVAGFYGFGIVLYLAGWLVLPAERASGDDPPSPGRDRPHPVVLVLLAILLLATASSLFRGGSFLLAALASLGLLFLLHRSRGHLGVRGPGSSGAPSAPATSGVTGDTAATGTADAPTVRVPASPDDDRTGTGPAHDPSAPAPGSDRPAPAAGSAGPGTEPPAGRTAPPAWDPLGAAPFAWDLPEPSPLPQEGEPPARRRNSRVTPVTLALAVVAGGVAALVMLLGWNALTIPALFATVLAVVGGGLVLGSFLGGGRGLIPVALLLAVLTWGSLVLPTPLRNLQNGIGVIETAPRTAAEVLPSYSRGLGAVDLDLRNLDLGVPAGPDGLPQAAPEPIRTSVAVGTGAVEVWLPPDADVTVTAHADLGRVAVGTNERGGRDQTVVVTDLGADGVRSGRMIDLDLRAGLGSVEVHRG